jgi:stage II sporulation protein D
VRVRVRGHAVALALLLPLVGSCFSRPITPDERPRGRRPRDERPASVPPVATTPSPPPTAPPVEPLPSDAAPPGPNAGTGPLVRVAIRVSRDTAALDASGPWRLLDGKGGVLVRARANERWRIERRADQLRAVRSDGAATGWERGMLTQYTDDGGFVRAGQKPYRGALMHVPTDTGILVVNLLPLDDYLRGVVPLEIGERAPAERAAVEAQAVAARSYTVTRLVAARAGNGRSADFDLIASVGDQVYGGQGAERPIADASVRITTGLVVLYQGRVVNAPFSSTCGGETAAAEEVWRSDGEPHLQRVSDKIPGSDRYYCDIAPRFAWTRAFTARELDAVVRRYLAAYTAVGSGGPGQVSDLVVGDRTPSGRVADLIIRTDRGSYRVRGNDARSVLRSPGGELLNSSYFSVTTERSGNRLARVVLRGNGYGHGVGMCQWGAIGRARAGQDLLTILRTYYPGTTVGPIPPGLLNP